MTLREWRTQKGWSQAHLANVLGKKAGAEVSQQSVHGWETGAVPNAILGEAIRRLTGGQVTWSGR